MSTLSFSYQFVVEFAEMPRITEIKNSWLRLKSKVGLEELKFELT